MLASSFGERFIGDVSGPSPSRIVDGGVSPAAKPISVAVVVPYWGPLTVLLYQPDGEFGGLEVQVRCLNVSEPAGVRVCMAGPRDPLTRWTSSNRVPLIGFGT